MIQIQLAFAREAATPLNPARRSARLSERSLRITFQTNSLRIVLDHEHDGALIDSHPVRTNPAGRLGRVEGRVERIGKTTHLREELGAVLEPETDGANRLARRVDNGADGRSRRNRSIIKARAGSRVRCNRGRCVLCRRPPWCRHPVRRRQSDPVELVVAAPTVGVIHRVAVLSLRGPNTVLEVIEAQSTIGIVGDAPEIDPAVRVLVAEERRAGHGDVRLAAELLCLDSIHQGRPASCRRRMILGRERLQIEQQRFAVAAVNVRNDTILRRPAVKDFHVIPNHPGPLDTLEERRAEAADFLLDRIALAEVSASEAHTGEQQTSVDRGQLRIPRRWER